MDGSNKLSGAMLKESLLYRLISGISIIRYDGVAYQIRGTSCFQKYLAEEYYDSLVDEYSQSDEMQSEAQLYGWMIRNNYWKEENEDLITKYKGDLEDLKVKLFESGFKDRQKELVKEAIKLAKQRLGDLLEQKHRFDFLTAQGAALIAKNKYLMGLSLYRNNEPLFNSDLELFLKSDFPFLDNIIVEYNKILITNEQIRFLARSDSWRKYWSAKEACDVFGKTAIELTDEQLGLISWTRVYDNIYQHPDCPSEDVIEDDDALDGFLIADKRKRDKEKGMGEIEKVVTNQKIKGADEIFIPVESVESAKKVYDLNDQSTRAAILKREKLIEEKGQISNDELPDIKLKRKLAINQKAAQLMSAK